MLRVAICDDERNSRNSLLEILKETENGQKISVREYTDGEKLIYEYTETQHPFDIIFLDMEMPVMDGMETAAWIRRIDRDVPIIIVTKHDEYTAWGYDVHAWHYLLKPVKKEKVRNVLREISEAQGRKDKDCFLLSKSGEVFRIPYDRILYFESNRNIVNIHTLHLSGNIRLYIPLHEIEQLCGSCFIRVHHSYLVNKYHIENISRKKGEAILSNGEKIRISRGKMKNALDLIESRIYDDARYP